jgi:hypothetical protein
MRYSLFLSLLISAEVFAWGATGHRAVGEIALAHLTPQAKLKLKLIMKGESLAQTSTWADEIKSEPDTYKDTFNWHFTDWPDEMKEHDETNSAGKLLTSINEQINLLKNPETSLEKKKSVVSFLAHLVGDLHMPLHVGNGLDRGGNLCKVTFHGKTMNLHSLWDEGLIEQSRLSFTELARFSSETKTQKDRRSAEEGSVVDWAKESKNLRAGVYPENVKNTKSNMSTKEYCLDGNVSQDQMPKLGYEYSYRFFPVVKDQIYNAGIRLAHLLNQNL